MIFNIAFCQITDLASELNTGIIDLVKKGNKLYFTSSDDNKVYELNLSDNSYSSIYTFSEKPENLYIDNDILYIGCSQISKTYSIDLTQNTLTAVFITSASGPMQKIGNELYIGQYTDSKIIKYNLVSSLTTDVISGFKPNYFAFLNNELYFTSNHTNKLYKFNINDTSNVTTILSNLSHPSGITFDNDYFFVGESEGDKISIYNLSDFSSKGQYTLESNSFPNGLFNESNNLYFIQTNLGRISLVNTTTLSIQNNILANKLNLYPNPTTEYLKIEGLLKNDSEYQIFNLFGQLIQKGKIENKIINLNNIQNGIYFLKADGIKMKFVKE